MKILHADSKVTIYIIDYVSNGFSKDKNLKITRGAVYEYFGMIIYFSTADEVVFQMCA